MKRLPFYEEEPGLLNKAARLSLGGSVWIAPGLVMTALDVGMWPTVAAYGAMGAAAAHPVLRKYLMMVHGWFWDGYKRFRVACWVSRVIREALENGGLVNRRKKEIRKFWTGEVERVVEVVEYPGVEIRMDEVNYYLRFRMLPGQTARQWEQKVDAFAHAVGGRMVASKIMEGRVELSVSHSQLDASEVLYKKDDRHALAIGYGAGGVIEWEFGSRPHCLVIGPTGTGKSTFIRSMLIQMRPEWTLKVCDGKQVEFSFLSDLGYDVSVGVEGFKRMVIEAQREVDRRFRKLRELRKNEYTDVSGMEPYFLVVDEAIYLIEALSEKKGKGEPKSERDEILQLMQDISLRGRAAGVFMVLIFQRPDSTFIPTVIRDNLMCKVVLGGSETALEMAFGREKMKGLDPVEKGHGYVMLGDGEPVLFRFPDYSQSKFQEDLAKVKGAGSEWRLRDVIRLDSRRREKEEAEREKEMPAG